MNSPVSFETAKLLKEKGFDKPVEQRYFIAENIDSDRFPFLQEECALHNWNDYDDSSTSYYSAPTIAEAVMWLYEKHGIWVSVHYHKSRRFSVTICDEYENSLSDEFFGDLYNSPTEAYEAAIKYVLTNLI